jgi:hypothetical protein
LYDFEKSNTDFELLGKRDGFTLYLRKEAHEHVKKQSWRQDQRRSDCHAAEEDDPSPWPKRPAHPLSNGANLDPARTNR